MALLLILPILSLAACIMFGCYSWIITMLATCMATCLLFPKLIGDARASRLANSIWLSMGCCLGHAVAILIHEEFARVIPAGFVAANSVRSRFPSLREFLKLKYLKILPLVIFGFWTVDRDIGSLIFAASALYIFRRNQSEHFATKVNFVVVGVTLLSVVSISYFANTSNGEVKTGIIQAGEWAKPVENGIFPKNLNQQLSYSYSGFRGLLDAKTIEVDSEELEDFEELWLITPTKPLSSQVAGRIVDWVRRGGHLVVVCDHTDLFGHARVTNSLLERFSVRTSTSALFKPGSTAFAADSLDLKTIPVKTSSTLFGLFATPLWSARQVEEREDYSTPNFFGPLSESIDDNYGRKVVGLRKPVGKGILTVHGDSTVFANFCVYQPGVPDLIQRLRSITLRDRLWPYLTVGYLLLTILGGFLKYEASALCLFSIVCLAMSLPGTMKPLNWTNFIWASGDPNIVMETGDPKSQFSTAYSLLGLSGFQPRWTKALDASMKDGIFYGEGNAPSNWKVVTLNSARRETDNGFKEWSDLYDRLGISPVMTVDGDFTDKTLFAGGLFTDDVMGNWWFDRGVSEKRMERFSAWLKWATGKNTKLESLNNTKDLWHSDEMQDYWLILFSGEEIPVRLPIIKKPKNGMQIYLGRGLSAEVVIENGQLSILGASSWTEAWAAPFNWVLVPRQK